MVKRFLLFPDVSPQLKSEVKRAAASGWFLPSIDPVEFNRLVEVEKLLQSQRLKECSKWEGIARSNILNWKSADAILTLLTDSFREHTYLSGFLLFGDIVQYVYKLERIPECYFRGRMKCENDLALPNMRHICQVSDDGSVSSREDRVRAENISFKLLKAIDDSVHHIGIGLHNIGFAKSMFSSIYNTSHTEWFSGKYEYGRGPGDAEREEKPLPTLKQLLAVRDLSARRDAARNRKNIKINPMEILASVSKLTNICK